MDANKFSMSADFYDPPIVRIDIWNINAYANLWNKTLSVGWRRNNMEKARSLFRASSRSYFNRNVIYDIRDIWNTIEQGLCSAAKLMERVKSFSPCVQVCRLPRIAVAPRPVNWIRSGRQSLQHKKSMSTQATASTNGSTTGK